MRNTVCLSATDPVVASSTISPVPVKNRSITLNIVLVRDEVLIINSSIHYQQLTSRSCSYSGPVYGYNVTSSPGYCNSSEYI